MSDDAVTFGDAATLSVVGVELASEHPERLSHFYRDALAFSCVTQSSEHVDMRLGACLLRLRRCRGRRMPPDSRSNDRWFRHLAVVVRDMPQACDHLRRYSPLPVSPEPQTLPTWNEQSGGIEAFYFRDPEGHPLELIHFPPGKGASRWHHRGTDLFQGVDHTAIVVASTARSLTFYRSVAGFEATAKAHNYGSEQERLTRVRRADLYATSLTRATAAAPGLELLEYSGSVDGREMPLDTVRNDAWWSSSILTRRPAGTVANQQSDEVALPLRELRDPDGYGVLII